MKTRLLILTVTLYLAKGSLFGQFVEYQPKSCLTIGVLQGGGSLIGFDFEQIVFDNIGLQIGTGFKGFGASILYHFSSTVTSSGLSITYWNQGLGSTYVQSLLGPTYVYRGKKGFTFQIGLGSTVQEGPMYDEAFNGKHYDFLLVYSLGVYIAKKNR